jgi:hypothetical protein
MQKVDFTKEMSAIQTALEAIASINEDQRVFALETIAKRLKIKFEIPNESGRDSGLQQSGGEILLKSNPSEKQTAKQFIASKKPSNDVQQIACLAYYLTHFKDKPHFKTIDLTNLNIEAAARKISNPSRASDNAARTSHFLAQAGKGNRQITTLGEEVVAALPDQEKVKQVIATGKSGRLRKGTKKSKAVKKEKSKL